MSSRYRRRSKDNPDSVKIHKTNAAIVSCDIEALKSLAREPKGFINDGLRRRAWPLLLKWKPGSGLLPPPDKFVKSHKDTLQVQLDVNRSFVYFPTDISSEEREQKQKSLSNVVNGVLSRFPELYYYQGFHDICSVMVLCLGETLALYAAERVSVIFLRDCMKESLDPALKQLTLIYAILYKEDIVLLQFLQDVQVLPFYALSWVITWYSHNIADYDVVTRLFDFFLSSNPIMPVYFAAAVTLMRRKDIMELEQDQPVVQSFLQKFPKPDDINEFIEEAIAICLDLYERNPVSSLETIVHSLDKNSAPKRYSKDFDEKDQIIMDDFLHLLKTQEPSKQLIAEGSKRKQSSDPWAYLFKISRKNSKSPSIKTISTVVVSAFIATSFTLYLFLQNETVMENWLK